MASQLETLIIELHEIGCVKFGSFTLKSGIQSPIYFDFRLVCGSQAILKTMASLIWDACSKQCDLICGVPYGALLLAGRIASKQNKPIIFKRKERKSHGTKSLVDGSHFEKGQSCIIIEDVVVSGVSILETVEALRDENLMVTEVAVFLDRSQGGEQNLLAKGITIKSVVKVHDVLKILHEHKKIDEVCLKNCLNFFELHKSVAIPKSSNLKPKIMSFMERSVITTHPLVKKIRNIIISKKTNLCVAVDVISTQKLLNIADLAGPHICILKTHINILNDFTKQTSSKLKELSLKHNFLLFEDSKFGDIGNTVKAQFCGGPFEISSWADIITFHGYPGPEIIKGLSEGQSGNKTGFVIVAEMSSKGNLCSSSYVEGCVQMAREFHDEVIGFVAQHRICENENQLLFTPGVNLNATADTLGQQYVTVEEAINKRGADIVIVGRGVTESEDPVAAAQKYKEQAYNALIQ